jgi:NADP-dependent 3-hydroxy acid dehydrogenase YdfG
MKVCMADLDAEELKAAHARLVEGTPGGEKNVLAVPANVARAADLEALCNTVYERFGEVGLLMNNAATRTGGGVWAALEDWHVAMNVNFWGVVHGVRAFVPHMIEQATPCLVVNTASKQGITNPPGNTVYNITKSALKTYTEGLAHEQHGRLPGERPSPGTGLDDDRQARAQIRRLAAGPGDRRAAGGARARRLLHHLPR